ncbi:flagellar basal body-associated protein FliL [Gallaecimonas sp. GXIMD1310]|uniref:flagellar basal body-associated protein FliL n=1 Tax=Gallaecimonas sp. GXIMD1310 TaxID=3131926 RepID=UPI00325310F9
MRYLLPLLLLFSPFFSLPAHAADDSKAQTQPEYGYYELNPDIITNYLGDKPHLGYLRVSVQLMVKNKAKLAILELHAPLLRDAIIQLIGDRTGDQVKSLIGREKLRKDCLKAVQELLQAETGDPTVDDLLFTKYLYY